MNAEHTTLLVKIIAMVLFAVLFVVLAKCKKKLEAEIAAGEATELDKLIYQFVSAADQLLKAQDPTGEKRKAYVYKLLEELGVVVTDIINAKIEAAVLKMPKESISENVTYNTPR